MNRMPCTAELYQQAMLLIGQLGKKLMDRSWMMGTAESCTGGLVATLCTEVSGSSAWFAGGVVSYANSVKTVMLGVDEILLERHGAVSGEVVTAMAGGLLGRLGVQAGIAFSGIAGPGGGSLEKPVGTVWTGIALAAPEPGRESVIRSSRSLFSGTRQDIRSAAALHGLGMLLAALE